MRKYNLILFDLDGTLFDFKTAEKVSLKGVFSEKNIELSPEQIAEYSFINKGLWKEYERGLVSSEVLRIKRFEEFAKVLKREDLNPADLNSRYIYHLGRDKSLYGETIPLLSYLKNKGYKMAAVTNGLTENQYLRVERSGLKPFFDEMVTSEEVGAPKPDTKMFEEILKRLGHLEKTDVILIGDSLEGDILGANRFGIDSIFLNLLGHSGEYISVPTYEADSHKRIYDIL